MKILHTADWHLGKKLGDFDRIHEQKAVLNEICQIADQENVDAVLIAGDLYDTFSPSNEAADLFYKTVQKLSKNGKRAVIGIAGNHDSPQFVENPSPLALANGIILTGYPLSLVPNFETESGIRLLRSEAGFVEIYLPNFDFPLRLILTAYPSESRLKTIFADEHTDLRHYLEKHWHYLAQKYCDDNGVNVLMAHLFMAQEGDQTAEEPEDEKSISIGGASIVFDTLIPEKIQYTALGHLHRFHFVGNSQKTVYSGSLLEYSFSEANQQKYVSVVELLPKQAAKIAKIPIFSGKKLERKTFEATQALSWLKQNPDVFVELSIESDTFLSSEIKKQLYQSHAGIVHIIPKIKGEITEKSKKEIDLSKSRQELFLEYFQSKKDGKKPSEELMALFQEISNS